jgi:hypothetical protein
MHVNTLVIFVHLKPVRRNADEILDVKRPFFRFVKSDVETGRLVSRLRSYHPVCT